MRPEGHTILDLANSLDVAKKLLADMLAVLKECEYTFVPDGRLAASFCPICKMWMIDVPFPQGHKVNDNCSLANVIKRAEEMLK